jgi:hypothetical protein
MAMDHISSEVMYLKNTFPRISDAKIKEGVIVGPQIRELSQDVKFEDQVSEVGNAGRKSLKNVTTNFLRDRKLKNYGVFISDLVQS